MRYLLNRPGLADTVVTDHGTTIHVYPAGAVGLHMPMEDDGYECDPGVREMWTPAELRELAAALHWAADHAESPKNVVDS